MTLARYIIGFALSLVLTLAAYFYVILGANPAWLLVVLGALAITQMIVQLVFFFHFGDETGVNFKLWSLFFMLILLLILVVGSIWVMVHLNENMMHMSPAEKTNYMMNQHSKGF